MDGIVCRNDLMVGMPLLGGGYRFSREPASDLPLLAGSMSTHALLRGNLILHCTQAHDLQDMESEAELSPGVKIVLLVDGATEVGYGRHALRLGPKDDGGRPRGGNPGALVNLAEPDLFHRCWKAGRPERKVSITLKPEWAADMFPQGKEAGRHLQAFVREHMASGAWHPSAQALAAAESILRPPPLAPGLLELYLEARCLDIVVDACSIIARATPAPAVLRPRQWQRVQQVRELLDSGAAGDWSLQRIAGHVGTNTTTLQLEFRAAFGTTVFAYLREHRMQQAHAALAQGEASIAGAAQLAGYTSSANFCTAFKHRFGLTPGQLQRP